MHSERQAKEEAAWALSDVRGSSRAGRPDRRAGAGVCGTDAKRQATEAQFKDGCSACTSEYAAERHNQRHAEITAQLERSAARTRSLKQGRIPNGAHGSSRSGSTRTEENSGFWKTLLRSKR